MNLLNNAIKFTQKRLPISAQHVNITQRVIELAPDQPSYKILFVDNNPDSRHVLVKFLAFPGFEFLESEDGQADIEVWKSWHPNLIFMDMSMPVLDGYEATQEIRRREVEISRGLMNHQESELVKQFQYEQILSWIEQVRT